MDLEPSWRRCTARDSIEIRAVPVHNILISRLETKSSTKGERDRGSAGERPERHQDQRHHLICTVLAARAGCSFRYTRTRRTRRQDQEEQRASQRVTRSGRDQIEERATGPGHTCRSARARRQPGALPDAAWSTAREDRIISRARAPATRSWGRCVGAACGLAPTPPRPPPPRRATPRGGAPPPACAPSRPPPRAAAATTP